MSDLKLKKEIESIFSKFSQIFTVRQDELKEFIEKYYIKLFRGKQIKDVQKTDATEQIKITGYRNYISAWKTHRGNPTISLCVEEEGVQKRYDYIITMSNVEIIEPPKEFKEIEEGSSFIEETEPTIIVGDISEFYDDSIRFMQSFQFEQAILKLDSMIELLLEKNLDEYSKKLEEKRDYLKTAYEIFHQRSEEFEEMDQKIADLTQDNILIKDKSQFQEGIEKINLMIKDIKGKALPEYVKVLEDKKKELEAAQEIYEQMSKVAEEQKVAETAPVEEPQLLELKNLERMIKINKEYNQYEAAVIHINKMMEILNGMNRPDLVRKYEQDLKEIKADMVL